MASLPGHWLLGMFAGWLAADLVLLSAFLGFTSPLLLGLQALASSLLVFGLTRGARQIGPIPLRRIGLCVAIAFVLLLLGGEGRLFYANIDWQVRDAVLRDMAIHPWPFAYLYQGEPFLLRAPIGMYLLPAIAWKAWGETAGGLTLLIQNALLLGGLLALASPLFDSRRGRWIALIVALCFGGLDIVGNAIVGPRFIDHLEGWLPGFQFSSFITLAFWVPQHALAGWLCGLLFLLWRVGKLDIGVFLAVVPLTALWSPLSMIGALPWAALAGVEALRQGTLSWRSLVLPLGASVLSLPALAYLGMAGDNVGIRLYAYDFPRYALFEALETLPWLVPVMAASPQSRFGRHAATLAGVVMLVIPQAQIGWSIDLMMRGAIPSQTVLAVLVAEILAASPGWKTAGRHWWLAGALALAACTGVSEINRAFRFAPVGHGRCSFFKAWDQGFARYPKGSYLAPLGKVPPRLLGQHVSIVPVVEPDACWEGVWRRPVGV
ncbi:hypothetical protein [Novosphingobium sp. MD-1]|uniref:hypothetical protein n=1 Tax=Novosphingobium sp. MD-1 TaxID=1630648 RepID=UPI00061BBBD0|nr:hypothetical protein [Novosphingobium sp. MD-1]GAO56026.1 hypothetical protein NMD1_03180 [Novosphingobium sp. MD-1]